MTSPDGQIPEKAYTAQNIWELQHVDQQELAAGSNADLQAMAESVRVEFFNGIYQMVQQIPIIGGLIGDIIEIITGVEDGDLNDLGSWINNIGNLVNNFIAAALHALADLLEWIPFVGDDLASVVDGIANGLNQTHGTATTAQTTAVTAQTTAVAAQTSASVAVSTAEAAANDAAAAVETADIAYENASYWEAECVVASAGVVIGINELFIGLCQNVPTGRARTITDLHLALLSQPAGIVIETKRWNAAGTSSTVIHTATLGANVTRISYNNLGISVADKERIFWNVTSITGTVEPNVLQCLIFGVIV